MLWSFLFLTPDCDLKSKGILFFSKCPLLSGETWEGVPRYTTAEGRYCRHTPLHSQMGKMKPEAIVNTTRNKYQLGRGAPGCYNVVLIYSMKPSPIGNAALQCSSDSIHHQTKTHQVTKPSAVLCIAEQRMLHTETSSHLLHNVVLNVNTSKHPLTHCLFPFGPTSALLVPTQEPPSQWKETVPIRKK